MAQVLQHLGWGVLLWLVPPSESCSNLESFFVNIFWGRRPDGVAINKALKIGYILKFNRQIGTSIVALMSPFPVPQ